MTKISADQKKLSLLLDKCIILDKKVIAQLKASLTELSPGMTVDLIGFIRAANQETERLINIGLQDDKNGQYLKRMKLIVNKTKKSVNQAEESLDQNHAEGILEDQLKTL